MLILAGVFLFCGATVAVVQYQYHLSKKLYQAASAEFTAAQALAENPTGEKKKEKNGIIEEKEQVYGELAPIKVDFQALQKVNPDVTGWIYCPDTVINYPVLHGVSNDTYLHHSYDRTYNASGSIFVDERNNRGFIDPVNILYGHHMASGAMFATLDYWQNPSYFDQHPTMWLLTPVQDFRVELYSCYDTSAYSETYLFPSYPGASVADYVGMAAANSYLPRYIEVDPYARYIVMSTCAYVFEDARTVLHGKLVPLYSAGGKPIVWNTPDSMITEETGRTPP